MRFLAAVVVSTTSLWTCGSLRAGPEPDAVVITAWNACVIEIGEAEDRLLTLKTLRTAAMMHLAMHDALNTIDPHYERYAYEGEPEPDADPVAASALAAFEVVVSQYPYAETALRKELERWLGDIGGGDSGQDRARELARKLGRACAAAVLEAREDDKWNTPAQYTWHPMGPGVYADFNEHSGSPEGFVFGAGWGEARPFCLPSGDHFRAPPPPEIDSDAYTRAFDEVKEVGAKESEKRTADQTHLALWWKDFVERSHNRLARELAAEEALGLWDSARMFALLNMSVFDGYVCVFENKFHYNHWRPYTAIRWAEHDGNPDTEPDTEWDNTHGHTYAFPSYPSAHGTACAAAMTILERTLGENYAFTMTTPEVDAAGPFSGKIAMDPPTRSFESFSAAADECGLSRLYLGIHFRYDSEEGVALGRKIGGHVWDACLGERGS